MVAQERRLGQPHSPSGHEGVDPRAAAREHINLIFNQHGHVGRGTKSIQMSVPARDAARVFSTFETLGVHHATNRYDNHHPGYRLVTVEDLEDISRLARELEPTSLEKKQSLNKLRRWLAALNGETPNGHESDGINGAEGVVVFDADEAPEEPESLRTQAMKLYLREVAQHRLLTAEEEVIYAKQLEAGKEATKKLARHSKNLGDTERDELNEQVAIGKAAR